MRAARLDRGRPPGSAPASLPAGITAAELPPCGHRLVTALLPQARRTSRAVVLAALAGSAVLSRRAPGGRAEQAVVLGALALGMPHGAADTKLLAVVVRHAATVQIST